MCVRVLLGAEGVEVNAENGSGESAIVQAAAVGQAAVVKLLLGDPRVDDVRGVLHAAVRERQLGVLEVLLESERVDVNEQNEDRETSLYSACRNGHEGVVKLLLGSLRVAVDVADECRETPLHLAIRCGHLETLKWQEPGCPRQRWAYPTACRRPTWSH